MKLICDYVKKGICGHEFQPNKVCKHHTPHEKSITCTSGFCTTANCKTMVCVPCYDFKIELPEDIFE